MGVLLDIRFVFFITAWMKWQKAGWYLDAECLLPVFYQPLIFWMGHVGYYLDKEDAHTSLKRKRRILRAQAKNPSLALQACVSILRAAVIRRRREERAAKEPRHAMREPRRERQ
jgi:hypothetical protein